MTKILTNKTNHKFPNDENKENFKKLINNQIPKHCNLSNMIQNSLEYNLIFYKHRYSQF